MSAASYPETPLFSSTKLWKPRQRDRAPLRQRACLACCTHCVDSSILQENASIGDLEIGRISQLGTKQNKALNELGLAYKEKKERVVYMAAMVQVLSVKAVAGPLQPSTLQKQGHSQVSRRCYVITASSTPEREVSRRNAVLGAVGASALSLLSLQLVEPALAGTNGARVVNPELRKKMREELERIRKENSKAKAGK